MWWVPLIGAAMGALAGQQQQKAAEEARKDQALNNMYAPLFGRAPQALPARQEQVIPGAISGGMAGYNLYSQMNLNDKIDKLYGGAGDSANPNSSAVVPLVQSSRIIADNYNGQNPYSYYGA